MAVKVLAYRVYGVVSKGNQYTLHYGQAADLLEKRQRVLDAAYAVHPERFVKKHPTVQSLPDAVWINRPQPLLETGAEPPLGV